ncbi:PREDICTED: leucine rich adaptor protein 1-like [Chinchilla lanigera]|nr:PREDICTED: leucine rich adaptor protein 1-like [Chinchilla lanigera]
MRYTAGKLGKRLKSEEKPPGPDFSPVKPYGHSNGIICKEREVLENDSCTQGSLRHVLGWNRFCPCEDFFPFILENAVWNMWSTRKELFLTKKFIFPSGYTSKSYYQVKEIVYQVNLRATDVRLMRQLLVINESIESIKWMIEEKATITSRGSSLSGSLCSLLESQSTSLRGSYSSLQDGSDGLDGISVGSYLDTLADDVPGHQTPSDLDQFSDSSIIEDSQALHKHPKLDSEYYCFG